MTIQVYLCVLFQVSLGLSTKFPWTVDIKIFAIDLPSQSFLGLHLWFHIFFYPCFLGLHSFFHSLAVLFLFVMTLTDNVPKLVYLVFFSCLFFATEMMQKALHNYFRLHDLFTIWFVFKTQYYFSKTIYSNYVLNY